MSDQVIVPPCRLEKANRNTRKGNCTMILRFAKWLHQRLCLHEDLVVDCQEKQMSIRCCDCGRILGAGSTRSTMTDTTDRAFIDATANVRWEYFDG